jgi:signal transduction histidine kinase/DNA-binding NarL/FixJ family response regulator
MESPGNKDALEHILTHVARVVPCDAGTILLINDGMAEITHARGHDESILGMRFPLNDMPHLVQVLETGHPFVVDDTLAFEDWIPKPGTGWIRSNISAAICAGEQVIGFLCLDHATPCAFTSEHAERLQAFVAQAAIAIENARLYDQAQQELDERVRVEAELRRYQEHLKELLAERTAGERQRADELDALRTTLADITAELELSALLQAIVERATELLDATGGELGLYDEAGQEIRVVVCYNLDENYVNTCLGLGEGAMGRVAEVGEALIVEDYQSWEGRSSRHVYSQMHGLLAVPLEVGGRLVGVIDIATSNPDRKFGPADVHLLNLFAQQAAIAIENARLFAEVESQKEAAEVANKAKSTFLANMSHELRTPLNAILGFAQLMARDSNITPEQQEHLETIGRSGEHLLALINDVLELSKIEAGRAVLHEESFDLHRLLVGLEEMFRLRAADKGVSLLFEQAEDVPQYVRMDQNKLRQVLINMLGNAVKFTQRGDVAMRVGLGDRGRALHFEVEDTGVGIASEELDAVFDAFVQTKSGEQTQEGTGLGIPISRQFVRMMGGDISVSSALGKGTLFRFDVRFQPADATDISTMQPEQRVIGLEPGQPAYRLLVVEDKEASRRLLVKLLEPLEFEVLEAANGQEGIEMWERWEPDLIWMDIKMPVMDGCEATRHIKTTQKGQQTIIIALTASAFEHDQSMIMSAGCDDLVRKPFRETEIFDKLAEHLGVRYIYARETEEGQPGPEEPGRDVLSPDRLMALPSALVMALQRATIQAKFAEMIAVAGQIRIQDGPLADELQELIDNFAYDQILTLIEQAESGHE